MMFTGSAEKSQPDGVGEVGLMKSWLCGGWRFPPVVLHELAVQNLNATCTQRMRIEMPIHKGR